MKRRHFVRELATVASGAAAALYLDPFRPRLRIARAAGGRTLVAIFQRGGCDGLNTVVPFGDSAYYSLRPTLGVRPPQAGNPAAALNLNGFFGLHPSLGALLPVYQAGQLAVLPAVQYPNASQSHFDGQQLIESGATDLDLDGWLNRHLVTLPATAQLRAAGFGTELPHALRGQEIVSSFNNIADVDTGLPPGEEAAILEDLTRVYAQDPAGDRSNRLLVQRYGRAMVNDLSVLNSVDPSTYVPENGATYPTGGLGRQLRQVAQLIKEDVGLEVAALSIGGWDTHADQGAGDVTGAQARRHAEFAGSIAAFHRDLGARMQDVVVLTMTEFGRTARENASRGTDHGHASAWFVVGGRVLGGVYGAWPGLATAQLLDGRYLRHSVDFRNVMGEVLVRHLGNTNLGPILPGHTYSPVGFLPA